MLLKNMNVAEASKSKSMIGGAVMMGVGIYMIYKGEYTTGLAACGLGLSVWGIRDNNAK